MKGKDFDKSVDVTEALTDNVKEKLAGLDPTSEEFERGVANLIGLSEAKRNELQAKNAYLDSKAPEGPVKAIYYALGLAMGVGVIFLEAFKGGVVSSQGTNFWDKIVRKF